MFSENWEWESLSATPSLTADIGQSKDLGMFEQIKHNLPRKESLGKSSHRVVCLARSAPTCLGADMQRTVEINSTALSTF